MVRVVNNQYDLHFDYWNRYARSRSQFVDACLSNQIKIILIIDNSGYGVVNITFQHYFMMSTLGPRPPRIRVQKCGTLHDMSFS